MKEKKTYRKPVLSRIVLQPDDMLLAGCKLAEFPGQSDCWPMGDDKAEDHGS